jgi:hypothetical protein
LRLLDVVAGLGAIVIVESASSVSEFLWSGVEDACGMASEAADVEVERGVMEVILHLNER